MLSLWRIDCQSNTACFSWITERVVEAQREGNVLIGIWRGFKRSFCRRTAGLDEIGKKRKEVLDINAQLQKEMKPGAFGDMFKMTIKLNFLKSS